MRSMACQKRYVVGSAALVLFFFLLNTTLQASKKPGEDTAGNNLSYPVIWAEGVAKALPGAPEACTLDGEYWYQWGFYGVDPDLIPASCPVDPDENDSELNPFGKHYCDDGVPVSLQREAGDPPADNPLPLAKAYLQKDPYNIWQAGSADWSGALDVHWIDWGDNLESVDWYTRSQVRTEVVLFQDLSAPMVEYEMRHVYGWGINEVHGIAVDAQNGVVNLGPGDRATVYSHCARLTIQRLLKERDNQLLGDLIWVPGEGWTEPDEDPENPGNPYPDDLVNEPIFNMAVHEAGDGPNSYSAEINVKGRIIYGYTWNVRQNNEGPGDYRITFSFDEICGTVVLNTNFVDGVTEILLPSVEDLLAALMAAESESTEGGGTAVLDYANNLTYIDVRILERNGGGGGKRER